MQEHLLMLEMHQQIMLLLL